MLQLLLTLSISGGERGGGGSGTAAGKTRAGAVDALRPLAAAVTAVQQNQYGQLEHALVGEDKRLEAETTAMATQLATKFLALLEP